MNILFRNTIQSIAITTSVVAGTFLTLTSAPAEAFTFTTNFEQNNGAKGDVWLKSIEMEDGTLIDDFSLITSAHIVYNDQYTGGNSGAASADMGDNATTGVKVENATEEDLVTNLNNLNLNNIVDTEDKGSFAIDLFFDNAIDNLLVWERGENSKLAVQALDEYGNLIGDKLVLNSRNANKTNPDDQWVSAGYSINTKEIGGSQEVAARGVSMAEFFGGETPTIQTIQGFRFFSEQGYNGPDWKIAGTNASRPGGPEKVPEPATILGLGAIGGLLATIRRRQQV